MTRPTHELPKLNRHVDRKNARVRAYFNFEGERHYCGEWGKPETTATYHRLLDEVVRPRIEERLGTSREAPRSRVRLHLVPTREQHRVAASSLLVVQVCAAYWEHVSQREAQLAEQAGRAKRKAQEFYALRPLRELFGKLPVGEFTPVRLIAYRTDLVKHRGYNRRMANRRVQQVLAAFKWAASRDLVPLDVYTRLTTVEPLARGEDGARESKKQKPVPDDVVLATLEHLTPRLATMVFVQLVTAMRPKELVELRGADLVRVHGRLTYQPRDHKNAHRGQARIVPIPPHVECMLQPYLGLDPEAFLFDPRDEVREQRQEMAHKRRTKVQPSQRRRHESVLRDPKDRHGDRYTTDSYARAIARACKRAGVPVWSPYRLRHTGATKIANSVSLGAAQAVLGHRCITTTMGYVTPDAEAASRALEQALAADQARIERLAAAIPRGAAVSERIHAVGGGS